MPSTQKPMRYGHTEGHTDVCFDDTGSCIVTCGSDGDVRIWENLDDDDPKSITVGEKAYSCALKNGKLITAVSNNTVQIHTFPEGAPDGILTRFTMNANHVIFNSDGTKIAAGSSDFMVKVVEVTDSSKQKTFRGHDAPVLSLSFDPRDVYLASASCDGSVRVWKIADQTCTTSWPLLQKCNDVISAKSICRLGWQPGSGKLLAIPVDKVVKLYRRGTWDSQLDLSHKSITQSLNVVAWSPCGQYLAAASVDGNILVWNVETQECIERMQHEKNYTICGLAWHPKHKQIAYADTEGSLGLLENIGDGKKPNDKVAGAMTKDYNDLFDGEDDNCSNGDMIEPQSSPKAGANEDNDDLIPTLGLLRRAIIDDDNSLDIGMIKANSSLLEKEDDDDQAGGFSALPSSTQRPFYDGPMPTPQQKPFQSGSTPAHLAHRFMVWNSVGIIRCYNDEQDNAIDVEFHDTSIHHATHLPNSLNHTMADLSTEAILLACESTEELASKLHCIHFSSWDTNKEWTVDMPEDEDIEAVCLGQGWAACATSALLVRVFTVGGVQKEIFSLPGPVVSMAGHGEQLMVIYHRGTGFDGDQCLGVQLMELGKKKEQILHGDPLSLTKKSYLTWVGFSAEGTPCYVDSEGIVRMLNRGVGNTWIPVCNTREHCKGRSDHYWVVGIHENPQQLRCIPCKGARFPPTLPRPAVAILPFKLPYCQVMTEKGQMEEQYWRSVVFLNHVDYLLKNGYEIDENAKSQSVKEQQELLMKLFALSCKLEREFRCVELADLMTQNVVNLAIKYASRSRKLNLAQRLNEMAAEKVSELATAPEDEEDFRKHLNAGYRSSATEWSQLPVRNVQQDQEMEDAGETGAYEEAEETPEVQEQRPNPFSKGVTSAEVTTPKSAVIVSSSQGRVNPFKVSPNRKDPVVPSANVLDTMSKYPKKTSLSSSRAVNKQNPPVIKPLIPKPKSKQALAASFFQARTPTSSEKTVEEREEKTGNESHQVKVTAQQNTENGRPKTGFQMWLEENRANILTDNPDLNEAEVIKEGMSRFRILSSEERMVWTEKAKRGSVSDLAEDKKRKRPTTDEDEMKKDQEQKLEDSNISKKTKPLDRSTNVRLSAFAFKQS
ncbi:WD repeat and HMG-box DNA-binding protein 1 [Falco biarmicus]|uniref:WD repeat and HMG-box DNA-binding protein 1 n=1 Tax=Falco cherrug TaxID=345164 RepID=UPI0018866688|nr:WD repeat and HMG-box DNA-binding protein 1 [Falco cherrug]XP_037251227.1 WD repeat and HMG-box DNA-binding protein 1 [Falco rusticolus]XP_037251228.1 WD repeat and HMG-box DNA-binding protein 1 [Falco rusticolus]XP_055572364.1 WD repeat and HMG-box DNA-binding protein 1 [Falco cherrug]XP_056202499.1 WD repeat and HMG-box DNA-binding protein 1 [Falco biarmicus]